MSTKIYTAWQIENSFLTKSLENFYEYCSQRIDEKVLQLMGAVEEEAWKKSIDFEEKIESHKNHLGTRENWEKIWERVGRFKVVRKFILEASTRHERDLLFDIECSCLVFIEDRWSYVIPFGENWIYRKFNSPPWMLDYSYWNNTDKPDNITQEEWNERSEMWNILLSSKHFKRNFYYYVMDVPKFSKQISPTFNDLEDRIVQKYAEDLLKTDRVFVTPHLWDIGV